jgi:hypothetical protein
VVITGWSDGRIPWPRCRPVGQRGQPGLLVDEELARAVRTESAAAVMYWWGVGVKAVWRWRTALGVTKTNNEGTHRLVVQASAKGGEATRARPCPPQLAQRRRQTAIEKGFGARLRPGYHGPWWTQDELALLGTLPDEQVAARIGRTVEAVRLMRTRRGIPTARDRRRRR